MMVVRDGSGAGLAVRVIEDVDQFFYDDGRVSADGANNVDELDGTEAALASFVLGDERLRFGQAFGKLCLGQTVAPAQISQQGSQLLLARRAQGVAHGGGPRSKATASAHNPSSGLSHFGIFVGPSMTWRS